MDDENPWQEVLVALFVVLAVVSGVGYTVQSGSPPWGQLGGLAFLFSAFVQRGNPRRERAERPTPVRNIASLVAILAVVFVVYRLTRPFLDEHPGIEWAVVVVLYGGLALWLSGVVIVRRKRAQRSVSEGHPQVNDSA